MSFDQTGNPHREPGRPQKRVDPDSSPLSFLAHALQDLKADCGNPTYETLEKHARIPHELLTEAARDKRQLSWPVADGYAHVPKRRLAEAARGDRLPTWLVVEGYVRGCWAYYEHKHPNQPPLDGTRGLAEWKQLYSHAQAAEDPRRSTGENHAPAPPPGEAPATGPTAPPRHAPIRIRRVSSKGSRFSRRRLAIGAGIGSAALLTGCVMLGMSLGSTSQATAAGSPAAPDAAMNPDNGMFVATPAPVCGRAASDGLRSPAATPRFSTIKPVYKLGLDGFAVDLVEGTSNGRAYDWVEAHPTGSRAGMQLRWAYPRGKWHYCTATLRAGSISALPDLVATMAVPAITTEGRRVMYQACLWHQHPYTAQCSPIEL